MAKPFYGRYYAKMNTVESTYTRAKKAEETPEDHSWKTILFYRGIIDRKEKGERRSLSSTESAYKSDYDRGYTEMDNLIRKEGSEKPS